MDRRPTQRILRLYDAATPENREASAWYGRGRSHVRRMARDHGVTERAAAGVVAAISPRLQWSQNLQYADDILAFAASGIRIAKPQVPVFRQNRDKAWRIALGEYPLSVLGGMKTRSFYRNLTGNLEAVTVDVWAGRAAGLTAAAISDSEYAIIAEAYIEAARLRGIMPAEMQAVVWVEVRGRSD